MKPVRVRFAPSPTGELHLGGVRTALFNWLFAKHHKGKFFLRIEDTDPVRSRKEYEEQICDSLKWFGLQWDGPIVFQSQRLVDYKAAIRKLLETGKAFRCFCSPDKLEKDRKQAPKGGRDYRYPGTCKNLSLEEQKRRLNQGEPFAVRLKIPRGVISFNDQIYGNIRVKNSEIDSFIISRSNGSPTYNLVVVVDDHFMGITHVIRGDDHLTNTPKQILIYKVLGFDIPKFAHLPMILGPDKRRLSKRHGATGIQAFRWQGYLPQALLNYLVFLGWNPDTEQEIFTLDELVRKFHLQQVQKKAAIYDEKKLNWISGQHMVQMPAEALLSRIRELNPEWRKEENEDYLLKIVEIQKKRLKTLSEIMTHSNFFFDDPTSYDLKTARKRWGSEGVNFLIQDFMARLEIMEEWSVGLLESELRKFCEERGISSSKLIHPVRLALSGVPHGPSLFLMMEMLGKVTCLRRLKTALEKLPITVES
ncbi:MAG: glutamate--tRNA ligase [Candidatus Marinimicrobia bacterium]|nr:glutamate--tRNA ligase [Candidatus Neomarinimicrobiota bacterium]